MSEGYTDMEQQEEQRRKRPVLLTVLCILSFVVVGFGLLGALFSLISGQPTPDEIDAAYNQIVQMASEMRDKQLTTIADMLEQGAELTVYQQHRYWSVLGINTLTMLTGFAGVLLMFRGKKLGFHLYIIYNLLSVGGTFLIVPSHMVPMASVIMNLIISGLFIFLYSLNLKWMNK
ncbi:hypothetical protein [Fluviicola chungangensis]|uniref:Uncharacterized protein n=1 Tax=Fluviicola chungangensis TaxID=2597671 RepID=A0A556MRT4_9FLAO|nr:hypothetical protein [Fluviicola chungangensis]TSJ42489.1 hypothetical protein FO442_12035 [Fluviicola chungangensis]